MKKTIKWLFALGGGLLALVIAGLLIAPMIIDIKEYKPNIEKYVSDATGCTFTLGEDLQLSLFPWISIVADDVHLENPPGFKEKYFLSVESFEVRVRLVPLVLSRFKDIRVQPFILKGARIILETNKDGSSNWEVIGNSSAEPRSGPQKNIEKIPEGKSEEGLAMDAVSIGEFAVTKGSFIWIDHAKDEHFEISDMNLLTRDVSLDRPICFNFSTRVDGHPLSIDGSVGPLGKDLGKGEVPIELSFNVLKQLHGELKGSVTDAVSIPRFDLSIIVFPFSPRKLMAAAGQDFPISTSDPKALTRVAFKADIGGNPENVEISEGVINIDDTTFEFTLKAGDFSKPHVEFALKLDEMDIDRYLPSEKGKDVETKAEADSGKSLQGHKKTDYAPLRRLVLDGTIGIGKLKVANARMKDLNLKITGRNGVFKLETLSLNLYQGNLTARGTLNVKQDVPKTSIRVQAKDIHSNPLLKDILGMGILEGKFNADLTLDMKGDDADRIKKSLGGKGILFIKDGAIKGIDLVSMVRNRNGAYGFARRGEETPRTEFSEFRIPLTIKNGIFNTVNTQITSELIRIQTTGKADLVKDILDLRIEPTFVTTSKKDKEKMKRSEVMIPIQVTGSLSSPEFHPDLKGVAVQKLEEKIFESSEFKKVFEKEELKPYEEGVKKLLKGILEMTPSDGK